MFNLLARFINMSRKLGRRIFTRKLFFHVMRVECPDKEKFNYSLAVSTFKRSGVIKRRGARAFEIIQEK